MKALWKCLCWLVVPCFVLFTQCKKEDGIVIKGIALHAYTKKPLYFIRIKLEQKKGWAMDVVADTYSKQDGTFQLKTTADATASSYYLATAPGVTYAAGTDGRKLVALSGILSKDSIGKELKLFLYPSGLIHFKASASTFDKIGSDTLVINSGYKQDTLTRSDDHVGFSVEPDETSFFYWFYIKNQIHSDTVNSAIFVPNDNDQTSTNHGIDYEITY